MGSIGSRLRTLEDHSREQAAAEVRRAWEELTDDRMALVLAPFHFRREPTPEEAAAEEEFREAVPELLIVSAIGYREDLAEEEVSRRLREMIDPVLQPRRGRLLRELQSLEEGR
ncbi:MAG: hypothetical protein WKF53_09930 [Rubrobacter sp.]